MNVAISQISCQKCSHHKTCAAPCIYVEILANGDKPSHEVPVSKLSGRILIESRDYNPVLAELIEDREERLSRLNNREIDFMLRLYELRSIGGNVPLRSVMAQALAGLTEAEIARMLKITPRHVRRIGVRRADQVRGR